jgi:hypothetical protein
MIVPTSVWSEDDEDSAEGAGMTSGSIPGRFSVLLFCPAGHLYHPLQSNRSSRGHRVNIPFLARAGEPCPSAKGEGGLRGWDWPCCGRISPARQETLITCGMHVKQLRAR